MLSVNKSSVNMTSIASCLSMPTSIGATRLVTCSHFITRHVSDGRSAMRLYNWLPICTTTNHHHYLMLQKCHSHILISYMHAMLNICIRKRCRQCVLHPVKLSYIVAHLLQCTVHACQFRAFSTSGHHQPEARKSIGCTSLASILVVF